MPNQCDVLHPIYGVHDCCLCNSRVNVGELKSDIQWLLQYVEIPNNLPEPTREYMEKRVAIIRQHALQGLLLN